MIRVMTIFIKTYIFVKVREGRGREGREGKRRKEGRKEGGREEGRKRGRKEGRKGGRDREREREGTARERLPS